MKEVMAFIRIDKIGATKNALAEAGFPALSCRKVMGRGKKAIDMDAMKVVFETGKISQDAVGEAFSEVGRLIPKRFITLIVEDNEAEKVAQVIIEANQTKKPGDGKVFILPIIETYRISTGTVAKDAY